MTVNGIYSCLPRDGNPVNVKRYVVAALANAKSMRVVQKKVVNDDGSMGFKEAAQLGFS